MCDWVCLYRGRVCAPGLTENSISKRLFTEFGNNEGARQWPVSVSASYILRVGYMCCSLKMPPSHPPCSSLPSPFKLEVEQTSLFSREGDHGVDYSLHPPLLFIHHLPLYPYSFLFCVFFFIICPHSNPMMSLKFPVHFCNNPPVLIGAAV